MLQIILIALGVIMVFESLILVLFTKFSVRALKKLAKPKVLRKVALVELLVAILLIVIAVFI